MAVPAYADKEITLSFRIIDSTSGEPLYKAICRVYTPTGKLHSYSMADDRGMLTVKIQLADTLAFSAMGYGRIRKAAQSFGTDSLYVVRLSREAVKLKELVVKSPPIRKKGDTIAYDVKSFITRGDTHLEDVLRKLPGIKVAENGGISYQGKAINRFYIEGKDLLGKSYNQASRNMPADAAVTIEILERHQPVSMLRGRQSSDNAAINIRLNKSFRNRPFGEIHGAIGWKPTIWDNSLFMTQILEKSQLMLTGKMSNAGSDLSTDTKEHIDVGDIDAYEPLPSSTLTSELPIENMTPKRYIRNDSYSAGINYLQSLATESSLRLNLLFYSDHSSYSNSFENIYGGDTRLEIAGSHRYAKRNLTIFPTIKYELNSKRLFLSDELKYSYSDNRSDISAISNGNGISEKGKDRPVYIQNYLSSAFFIGRQIVQVKSFIRFLNKKERLGSFADSIAAYTFEARLTTRSFKSRISAQTTLPFLKGYFRIKVKSDFSDKRFIHEQTTERNENRTTIYPSYGIGLPTGTHFSFDIPLQLLYIRVDQDHRETGHRQRLSILPGVTIRQTVSALLDISLYGHLSAEPDDSWIMSATPLRSGYRTVISPDTRIFLTRSRTGSLNVRYKNLASMFFANLSATFRHTDKEAYRHYSYGQQLTSICLEKGDNHATNLTLRADADKSFSGAGMTLKTSLMYSNRGYLLSQSGTDLFNHSNIISMQVSSDFHKLSWLRIYLNVKGNLYWQKNRLHDPSYLKSVETTASAYLFPTGNATVGITLDCRTNEISSHKYVNCAIIDLEGKYKISNRWEAGVTVANVLATKNYSILEYTGLDRYFTSIPLRGREVMLRLAYRF